MIKKLVILLFSAALLLPTLVYGSSNAGNEHLFTVSHSGKNNYFHVLANPGQTISLGYSLENKTEKEITNSIIVYDSKTAVNGGNVIMSPESMIIENASTWFNENNRLITLQGGSSKTEEINFTVPDNCEPGVYTAIFGLYSKGDDELVSEFNKEDVQLDIKSFYTSTLAIVIEVGENPFRCVEFGDEVTLETDSQTGGCFLYVPVINWGNAYEFPIVDIEVRGNKMNTVFKGEVAMDIVYGKTESYACFNTAEKILEDGVYSVLAKVKPAKETGFNEHQKLFYLNIGNNLKKEVDNIKLIEAASDINSSGDFFILSKSQIFFISLGVLLIVMVLIFLMLKKKKSDSKLKT